MGIKLNRKRIKNKKKGDVTSNKISDDTVSKEKPNFLKGFLSLKTVRGKVIAFGSVAVLGMTMGYSTSNFLLSGNVAGGTVATYESGSIQSSQLYNKLKNNLTGSKMVLNTLLYETFGNAYGSKISDKEVEEAYPNYLHANLSTITNDGGTENQIKELVRQQLALQYGLRDSIEVDDSELKEWWEFFYPDVTVKVMLVGDKETAEKAMTELSSGKSFKDVSIAYKDQLGLGGQDVTVSINSQDWTPEQRQSIYEMKDGDVKLIEGGSLDVYGEQANIYYLVKMVENVAKGKDMSVWVDDMTAQIKEYKIMVGLGELTIADNEKAMTYREVVNKAIAKVFKDEKVRITDVYMARALRDYLGE